MLEQYPEAMVVSANSEIGKSCAPRVLCPRDGQRLFDVLQVVHIPGHTPDAIALLDTRTGTLLSGDCLQAYGIYGAGPWGSAIRSIGLHFEALDRLRKLELQQIVTAHDYHPFRAVVEKKDIGVFLDSCVRALLDVRDIMAANPTMDDEQLVQLCNSRGLPRIDHRVIAGLRKAMDDGIL